MLRERNHSDDLSEFLRYLADHDQAETQGLPSMAEMSRELGASVSALREQLEVARALGLVEVRPRTGMRRLPYTFLPAVRQSLAYAIACDREYFTQYAELRRHIETAFWYEAVRALTEQDKEDLQALVDHAWIKLRGTPVQIPHDEHRQLHLMIYSRLANSFVTGLLEAYWEAYETVGLDLFTGYEYLQEVWQYHTSMVKAIRAGDYEAGYRALLDHTDLIFHRPPIHPSRGAYG